MIVLLGVASLCASAKYVNVVSPYNYTVNQNSNISIGNVGPGQTIYIMISSETTNNTGTLIDYGWNRLVATDLPPGWIAQNSSLNIQFLSTKVAVAPNAPNGTYSFDLTAINTGNYSRLGSLSFKVFVNVTPDVFSLGVTPSRLTTWPNQPANILVSVDNTGVSDSPFTISVVGLPAWNTTATVIALHNETGKFVFPVYEGEPGVYNLRLYVNSTNSKRISKASNLTLVVRASVPSDYSSIGKGYAFFPIVYAPVYGVMYIIDLVARHL